MTDKVEILSIDMDQEEVIAELQQVLDFLKSKQIKNKDTLVNIKKPLDDLRSSLKYLPTDSSFDHLPNEITTNILSYLCDSNAFIAAAVCLRWKGFLQSRFTEKEVIIGRPSCDYRCRDNMCLIPSEMLKAAATHKLGVHLSIQDSVLDVDSKIVTDGLTSVSKFSLIGDKYCPCNDDSEEYDDSFESSSTEDECNINPLSLGQLEDLFKGIEEKADIMKAVKLDCLDLNELNEERVVNCFVNKIENLTLLEMKKHGRMFDVEKLVRKLSQDSTEIKLKRLALNSLDCPGELNVELANALCNVENVTLYFGTSLQNEAVKQLVENIVTHPVKIKTLIVRQRIDFNILINPDDLKKLFNKMTSLQLHGYFTLEQLEAVRSIPEVQVWERGYSATVIYKGCNILF